MSNLPNTNQENLSISQAAKFLEVSIDTLRRWEKKGLIKAKRLKGKDRLFSLSELERVKFNRPLSISQTSKQVGLSASTLRRLEERGILNSERNNAGERVYSKDTIAKFVESDYFLKLKQVQVEAVSSEADDQNVPAHQQTTHKILSLISEENKSSVSKLQKFIGGSIFLVISASVLIIVILTAFFSIYPHQTARFLGYDFSSSTAGLEKIGARVVALSPQLQQLANVLGTSIASESAVENPSHEGFGQALQPFGDISLFLIKQFNPDQYNNIIPERFIKNVNDIFKIDQEGYLVPKVELKFPALQTVSTSTSDSTLSAQINHEELLAQLSELEAQNQPAPFKLTDGIIITAYLADGAVTTEKIAASSITTTLISDGAVTSSKIANGTIVGEDISDGTIGDSKLIQITSSNKVAGSAVQLASGGGLINNSGLSLLNTCTLNQVLVWDGSSWICADQSGSGGGGGVSSLNTLVGDLTIVGGGINSVSEAGSTITITATEADTLASVTGRGAATATALTLSSTSNAITAGTLTINSEAFTDLTGDGLTISAGTLTLAPSVAGSGLTYSSGVLAIGQGNGITVNGDDIEIDTSVVVTLTGVQTLTNKTIDAGSNTISNLTNANLSGSAGITNANLANSSITFAADSGSSATSLGGTRTIAGTSAQGISTSESGGTITITAANAVANGSTKGVATFNSTNFSDASGVINTIQNINTGASPAFTGLNLSGLTASRAVFTDASKNFSSTADSLYLINSLSDETGSGGAVFATSPSLVTPVLGVATATSLNGLTITSSTGVLTIANGKTFTANNTLTLAGTDSTTITFQGTDTYVGRATTDTLTNKTLTDNVNSFADDGDPTKLLKFDTANVGTGTTLTLGVPSSPGTSDTICLQTKANCTGASTWSDLSSPTSDQTLTFDDGEQNIWTVSSDTETFWSMTADSMTSGTLLDVSLDGLTSGKGFNIASTSTALTTGNLINLDWSPGSATTASGDLFSLNIGANGTTTGYLFTIKDSGASVLGVSETQFTTSLPSNFTAPGDVSVAYDIQFTNPTASYIKSYSALTIQPGDPFGSSNLTLSPYNEGSVYIPSNVATAYGVDIDANLLSTGRAVDISSSSTAGGASGASYLLYLDRTGANSNATHTAYGILAAVANTGTTLTNVGAHFTASSATASSNAYSIQTGAVTAASSGTVYSLNTGALTGASSATVAAINTGAISGAGTTSYGIRLGANSATATSNFGIDIGAVSGAGTTNTGIRIGAVSGASNNYALITGGGNVGIGDSSPAALLTVGSGDLFQVDSSGNTTLQNQADLRLGDADGTNYVAFQAPTTVGTNVLWTLPSADSSGCFKSDGSATVSIGSCGASTWSDLSSPTADQTLTFDDGEQNIWTVSSDTETFWSMTADSMTSGTLFDVSLDGLTSGKGFNVASTSTALTTGNLINLDWSPGSATTATGDLFKLNIGSNGSTTGNLFNILDSSASIFSVSETSFTTSLPSNFTAPGDVAAAYDVVFTNPTASYIKSAAPLAIVAGETFNSSNLSLQTYNQGTIVFETANTTSTALDFTNSTLATGTGFNISTSALTTGTALGITANAATSGKGITVSSSATAFTGSLINLTLSGSNAANTGQLLSLTNSGAANTGTTLLIQHNATGTNNLAMRVNDVASDTSPFVIDGDGNVGVGQAAPALLLHVGDTSVTDATNLLRLQDSDSTCDFNANSGAPTCGSDITLKKDISSLDPEELLAKINELRPVSYHWKTDSEASAFKHGFIAQEVAEQFPELVTEGKWIDGSTRKFLSVGGLMPYLVGAMKAQQNQIDSLAVGQSGQLISKSASQTIEVTDIELSENGFAIKTKNGKQAFKIDDSGNAFIPGTLTVGKLIAGEIAGLEVVSGQIATLENRINNAEASSSALLNNIQSQNNVLSESVASTSASVSTLAKSIEEMLSAYGLNGVSEASSSATSSAFLAMPSISMDELSQPGIATVSGRLEVESAHVKNNLLVEAILNVVDTLTTRRLIVSEVGQFLADVMVKGNLTVQGWLAVGPDTAGTAVVLKDQDFIYIQFNQEYPEAPLINATLSIPALAEDASAEEKVAYHQFEKDVLSDDLKYIVTDRGVKGFSIKLNKTAPFDLTFNWTAVLSTENDLIINREAFAR